MRTIAALVLALVAQQAAPGTGRISGFVIKAGTTIRQPLRNARLELTGSGNGIVRTDVNGAFSFSGLMPGQYQLAVTCDGFVRQELRKNIVLGRGQQVANIIFELDPAATATGRVLDTFGEPISNVMIDALHRTYDVRGNPRLTRAAAALTDDRGEYRIFWLDPGNYFLYASSPPPPETSDSETPPPVAPTYYPDVNTPEDARTVRLELGREARADFRLRQAAMWPVGGHTMNGLNDLPVAATVSLIQPGENPNSSRYHAQSLPSGRLAGEFSMRDVPPGSYLLTAKSLSGDRELTAFQHIELRPILVAPQFGFTTNLGLTPPVSLNGRLFFESAEGQELRQITVALVPVDPDMPLPRSVPVQPDGLFVVNGIYPGDYVLEMSNLPQDLYLKATRFGNAGLERPLTIEAQPPANPLQILLGSDGGHMQAQSLPGANFVLVPDAARRGRREQYRVAGAGDDGRVTIRGIPPGNYTIFAWEDLEPNAYLNADYLQIYEDRGVPVRISPGENPAVAVRMIPKE